MQKKHYLKILFSMLVALCIIAGGILLNSSNVSYADSKDGWVQENGSWHFYENGEAVVGWKKINGNWYYFFYNNNMAANGWFFDNNDIPYHFNSDGAMDISPSEYTGIAAVRKVSPSLNWSESYYIENGSCFVGWKKINGTWYYYSDTSEHSMPAGERIYSNIKKINGVWYEFDSDGALSRDFSNVTGFIYSVYYSRTLYLVNGQEVYGWRGIDNNWYYFDENGYMARNTVVDGCYLNYDGIWEKEEPGWHDEEQYSYMNHTEWYYVYSNGQEATGWFKVNGRWYYADAPTSYSRHAYIKHDEFAKIDGKIYCFNESGAWLSSGKITFESYEYLYADKENYSYASGTYFADSSSKYGVKIGWVDDNGTWYYYEVSQYRYSDGTINYNVFQAKNTNIIIDGTRYIFDANGKLVTGGWYSLTNSANVKQWYYTTSSGRVITGWKQINNKWYYFDSYGVMVNHHTKVDGVQYYFRSSGELIVNDWVKVNGNWYYTNSSGRRVTGWNKINGKWYYFYSFGSMAYNETIDGYYLNSNGVWEG